MPNNLKDYFLLEPDVIFLNHGSFGACPRPVFEAYQFWQRKLESQPVRFLQREFRELDQQARQTLGEYLHACEDDLVYIPNATYGVNIVARSIALGPGDEILATDHEYGACNHTWEFVCQKTGAAYCHQPIPLPVAAADEIVDEFWRGVTPRTKVIFLSHITSPTALRLPVEAICQRAREAGILTLIDGAHAPGQTPLDMQAIASDFYIGNCHKWLLSPKGVGFFYARPEVQHLVEPLVVSFYQRQPEGTSHDGHLIDFLRWTGTRDPAAELAVPAAIHFMAENHWDQVSQDCHDLLRWAIGQICTMNDIPPAYPVDSDLYCQMGIAPLLPDVDLPRLKNELYDRYQIEVPMTMLNGQKFIRISVQGYNTPNDLEMLVEGLRNLQAQV